MTWIIVLKLILQLAAYAAKRAERRDIERALLNELEIVQGRRIRDAQAARDDVLSGRVPIDPNDPNRRD